MVNLLLAIHNHQPVGNFDNVIEEAYVKSYRPFLDVLEQFPQVKLALHYTGSLIDWFEKHHPEFIARVRRLVETGQVEIFAGGYYEPILTLIPEDDAIGQGHRLVERIKDLFGYDARGSWIAERVWEPKMPRVLNRSGLEYGIVDDSHFGMVGFKPEALTGFYDTEEQGSRFCLFPCCEQLRYVIPFGQPEKAIEYLARRHQQGGDVTLTYGDDGEKFGLWPETYEWVYNKRWLHRFFSALDENRSWIRTMTFKDYHSQHRASGQVYLPCASYREMLEWSGGFYRNFMVKYPEINLMHKRMLFVSQKISGLNSKDESLSYSAKDHLYMAQANDAYWHGVFGGLYLNHLRSAVYQNLIKSETLAEKLLPKKNSPRIESVDFDCDGKNEVVLRTQKCNFYFKPNRGGTLFAWDDKDKSWNLVNTINRREEPYHKKIRDKIPQAVGAKSQEIASIHDRVVQKQEGLADILFYDKNPRHCFVDHFLTGEVDVSDFLESRYQECADFVDGDYQVTMGPRKTSTKYELELACHGRVLSRAARLTKKFGAFESGLTVRYELQNMESQEAIQAVLAVEFNFSVYDPQLITPASLAGQKNFQIKDAWNGFDINFGFDQPADIVVYPVETVSDSETGIERSFQELCCVVLWPVEVSAGRTWAVDFKVSI